MDNNNRNTSSNVRESEPEDHRVDKVMDNIIQDYDAPSNRNDVAAFRPPSSVAFKIPTKKLSSNATLPVDKPEETPSAQSAKVTSSSQTLSTDVVLKVEKYKLLSPAEILKQTENAIPYKEPTWGCVPTEKYSFEVLKNGAIVDDIQLSEKSYHIFGRLPSCDVQLEHPSLSRYHAVVQYCNKLMGEKGWYVYDMDSTHGTWVNKKKIQPNTYTRIRVGHQVKFGGSTRVLILQGPVDDQDSESELSVTEMKRQLSTQTQMAKVIRHAEREIIDSIKSDRPDTECSWGMPADAEEEENTESKLRGDAAVLSGTAENEVLYIDDPKKALKGFFEREGLDLPLYEFSDGGFGKKKCTVELPIDDPNGRAIIAEVISTGKKKELTVACALEACRILDRHGVLRASTHDSHRRKKRNWEEDDFYSSDEDTFLDRTGTIEKKRACRMKKDGKKERAETHDDLVIQHEKILKDIKLCEQSLEQAKRDQALIEDSGEDALDAYMNSLKSGGMDASTKVKIRVQLMGLKKEEARLSGLISLTRPASIPHASKKVQPMNTTIAKVRCRSAKPKPLVTKKNKTDDEESEEHEEWDEDEEKNENQLEKNIYSPEKTKPKPVSNCGNDIANGSSMIGEFGRDKSNVQNKELHMTINTSLTHKHRDREQCHKTDTVSNKHSASESNIEEKLLITPEQDTVYDVVSETSKDPDTSRKNKFPPCNRKSENIAHSAHLSIDSMLVPQLSDCLDAYNNKTSLYKQPRDESSLPTTYSKNNKQIPRSSNEQSSDVHPDFEDWLPPQGQSGDGKTALNKKFGY